jgi:hypothetical protein
MVQMEIIRRKKFFIVRFCKSNIKLVFPEYLVIFVSKSNSYNTIQTIISITLVIVGPVTM